MSNASRLANASLRGLPGTVARPLYDRDAVTAGIVHLGVGAFHRAHQAVFVDDCLNGGDTGWGIVGASSIAAGSSSAEHWPRPSPTDIWPRG